MIHVTIDPKELAVCVTGHADAPRNDADHDLVCCSVSVLIQTLAYTGQEDDGMSTEGYLRKGDAYLRLIPCNGYYKRGKTYMRMLQRGLEMLQESYPAHIRVAYGEVAAPGKIQ